MNLLHVWESHFLNTLQHRNRHWNSKNVLRERESLLETPYSVNVCVCCTWRCWLGGRKGIRLVKKLSGEVPAWLSVWNEVQTYTWPSWCHFHSLSLALVKSRLVLRFWYRLTRVVPDKGPLNGCVCVHWRRQGGPRGPRPPNCRAKKIF